MHCKIKVLSGGNHSIGSVQKTLEQKAKELGFKSALARD